ncbi:GNAT family N-acetyltransferase [Gymnodinialimonas sp. 2305UL16-5]|uniref:GNAT family N-acetyltransferase n=1 Tax=Gymnodinialimonas mytili TaxID=3126503 RepID=UPI00309C9531
MKIDELIPVIDATWPATETHEIGGFAVKRPDPGGNRVSATRLRDPLGEGFKMSDLDQAETMMRQQDRAPLFMVTDTQTALNDALEARGYNARDHTNALVIRSADIAAVPPPVTAFDIWPPLAIQTEIWEAGGVDLARRTIMDRALCPKTSIFGRINDQPAGSAYLGIHNDIAMLHALEVVAPCRRMGLAAHMMRKAADWAVQSGATWLCVLVTQQNKGAQRLYSSLGMKPVGTYHYREQQEAA